MAKQGTGGRSLVLQGWRAVVGCRWHWVIHASLHGPCSVWQKTLQRRKALLSCSLQCSFPVWDSILHAGESFLGSIHPAVIPKWTPLRSSSWPSLEKSSTASSPGSVLGCQSQFCCKLGDFLQDQSQRRSHRVWGADSSGFPSPRPIPLCLASCEHRLLQLQRGGGSGKRCTKPWYPIFRGWERS